ncbi:MAG: anaerobic selenocysteine-containing dehydrogenase [Planctomycetota bacterium]
MWLQALEWRSMAISQSTCPLDCPDACGVLLETDEEGRLLKIRGNPDHGWSRGHLCSKTAIYADAVTDDERLRTPLIRDQNGEFQPSDWPTAIDLVARRLGALRSEQILSLSYAGNMGVIQRSYPSRIMNALGAMETDGGICDSSATAGYENVMGHVIGPDIETARDSDFLLMWGVDARRTHQHLMPAARALTKRGDPVVVIDIYETDTIRSVRAWGGTGLIVKPGSDAALALCLTRMTYEVEREATEFLTQDCLGASEFREHVMAGHDLEGTALIAGISVDQIRELHATLMRASRPFLKTGVGWTRRRNGAMSMRAVCAMAAVMGYADLVHFESGGNFDLDDSDVKREGSRPEGAPTKPIRHVELGLELMTGRFGAAVVWGHNPLITVPDSVKVRAGLTRDDLFLVVHDLFMTETAKVADVVLPATSIAEHSDVFKSYGHRWMQYSHRAAKPWHEARSNVDAFRALGEALKLPADVWSSSEEELVEEFLAANRNRISDEQLSELRSGKPVKLPTRQAADRGTPSGKIELHSAAASAGGQPALPTYVPDDAGGDRGSHWLIPAPSVVTHNSTYLHSKRHSMRRGEAVVCMNSQEMLDLGFEQGERVHISNDRGYLILPVAASDQVPAGMVRIDGVIRPDEGGSPVGVNGLTGHQVSDLGDGSTQFSHRVDLRSI